MKIYNLEIKNLNNLIADVLDKFSSGTIILRGDLASGKTTFVKKFVEQLGITGDVTSPTFSLQQCYGKDIFHYDIYNHGLEHFISLGMLEELDKDGLHFVEWGDLKLEKILLNAGMKVLVIEIKKISQNSREYRVNYA